MKAIYLLLIIIVAIGVYWFIKIDTNDNKARKDSVKVIATITKLRCKQRLKGDKSLMIIQYQSKEYSIFLPEKKCFQYSENQELSIFYSKAYDKVFLEK